MSWGPDVISTPVYVSLEITTTYVIPQAMSYPLATSCGHT